MFENITRDQFRVDMVLPAIQTAVAIAATQAAGRLNHYSVSAQSTVLIAYAASTLSSLANNFFAEAIYQYLAIPLSVGAGLFAHRFFYPGTELSLAVNAKELLIISGILVTVKFIAENFHRLKIEVKKGDDVKEIEKKAEKAAEKAEKKAEKAAKEAEKKGHEAGKNVEEKIADAAKKVKGVATAAVDKIKEKLDDSKEKVKATT